MPLETGTYISDLVVTNPAGTDTVNNADDHLRLIKSTIKTTFPNITGALTATHTQLNYVTGVTSAIQTQLDGKASTGSANTFVTGQSFGTGTGASNVLLNGGAGFGKSFNIRTGGSDRWSYGVSATAESGSNAGSDFYINRHSDAGAFIDTPIFISRSTGAISLATDLGIAHGGTGASDAATARTNLGLGTAATLNVGTAANNIIQLDGTAKLPAVDGSQLTNLPSSGSTGRLLRAPQVLTSGTSYTTPAGCTSIYVELVGGGGAGGSMVNTTNSRSGAGGGAGGYAAKYFTVTASTAYTYAVGAAGGNTTFTVGATTVTANAGSAGGTSANTVYAAIGGAGGTATNGDINVTGGTGISGGISSGTSLNFSGGNGGASYFGGGGIGGTPGSGAGGNGTAYGSGGGGGSTTNVGGNGSGGSGAQGVIRIWEYA